jgi:pimeloyl-ACP methyl ester carboxylesterase
MAVAELPDGRVLEYVVGGSAGGLPLVLHHGTPSGAVLDPGLVAAAGGLGCQVIQAARPGYGGSTPRPARSVADVAADTVALLDHLGLDRFVTLGWSGGGPHAMACAALLPGRCRAAATLAGVAPYGVDGLDWLDGMGAENIAEFGAALAGERELTAYLEREAAALAEVRGEDLAAALGDLVSDVDRAAAARGGFGAHLAESIRSGLAPGIAGWRDDDLAFVKPWGFALDFEVPVAVWQGDQDRMVPFGHGRWFAAHVPDAAIHLLTGEGHLSLHTGDPLAAVLTDLTRSRR